MPLFKHDTEETGFYLTTHICDYLIRDAFENIRQQDLDFGVHNFMCTRDPGSRMTMHT